MIKKILSYLSLKSFLLFFSKFSFGRFFTPYFRAFLRIFFSDRKTAFLIKVFASFFGVFRLFNALLGFLIFINLYSIKGLNSIPAATMAFFSLIKKEFFEAFDRYWPNHPPFPYPSTFSQAVNSVNHTVSDVIHHSPVATDLVHGLVKEVKKVETLSSDKFESLRKLYSNYKPTWDWFSYIWKPAEDSYNLFLDWKFYVGTLIALTIFYWFFGAALGDAFSKGMPSNPFKRDDDHGRPGNFQTPQRAGGSSGVDVEAQHVATPGSEYRRTWPGRMYEYLQERFPWRKSTVARTDSNLQASDLPSVPNNPPVSSDSKGKFKDVWVSPQGESSSSSAVQEQISPSIGKRKAPTRASETIGDYQRVSLDEQNVSEELRNVSTFSQFFDYIRPKATPPRITEDPNYVDPYAHVRATLDPYMGENVFVAQDQWGYKTHDLSELALLRISDEANGVKSKTSLPFVEPELVSELGDVPPSLTDDRSSIVDDNSVIDEALEEMLENIW